MCSFSIYDISPKYSEVVLPLVFFHKFFGYLGDSKTETNLSNLHVGGIISRLFEQECNVFVHSCQQKTSTFANVPHTHIHTPFPKKRNMYYPDIPLVLLLFGQHRGGLNITTTEVVRSPLMFGRCSTTSSWT